MTRVLFALRAAEEVPGPASPFKVESGLFIWTWVVFIALFLLLKKFAWPAILRATEEREQAIRPRVGLEVVGAQDGRAARHRPHAHAGIARHVLLEERRREAGAHLDRAARGERHEHFQRLPRVGGGVRAARAQDRARRGRRRRRPQEVAARQEHVTHLRRQVCGPRGTTGQPRRWGGS